MSKLFIIRDDDLNFFSCPQDIDSVYGDLFSENIPVSFSVIPFVKKNSDVYTKNNETGKDSDEENPIGDNMELIEYIKKNNSLIEILLHGYSHEIINCIYEFNQTSGLELKTRLGYEYLQKLFGKIEIFVPPHDSISNHGILSVESCGLNIIRSKGSRNFIPRFEYLIGLIKMILHRLKHLNRYTAPAYPKIINFGKHKESYSHRLSDNINQMKEWLHFAEKNNSNFIVVNHLHNCSKEQMIVLRELIDEAKKLNFEFVKASKIFN